MATRNRRQRQSLDDCPVPTEINMLLEVFWRENRTGAWQQMEVASRLFVNFVWKRDVGLMRTWGTRSSQLHSPQIVFHFIITTSGWRLDESTLVGNVKTRLGSQKISLRLLCLIYDRNPISCSNPEPRRPGYVNVPVKVHFTARYVNGVRGPEWLHRNSTSTNGSRTITVCRP